MEANRTTLATSILQSSEGIARAIANTLKNMDTYTVSRTNLGTCPYETLSCNKSSIVKCDSGFIHTILYILQQ